MIIINHEFKSLIPDLLPEEYQQLEQNILAEGIRDPLVVWGNTLIDGHNRYEIAERHGLKYKTVSYEFKSENDVKLWILKTKFGRRNLTDYDRARLALKLKPIIAEKAKERQKGGQGGSLLIPNLGEANPIRTDKELAKISGVSHGTMAKVERIENKAIPEIKEQIKVNKLSIHDAEKATHFDPEKQKTIIEKITSGEAKSVDDAIKKMSIRKEKTSGNKNGWKTAQNYKRYKTRWKRRAYFKRLSLIPPGTGETKATLISLEGQNLITQQCPLKKLNSCR